MNAFKITKNDIKIRVKGAYSFDGLYYVNPEDNLNLNEMVMKKYRNSNTEFILPHGKEPLAYFSKSIFSFGRHSARTYLIPENLGEIVLYGKVNGITSAGYPIFDITYMHMQFIPDDLDERITIIIVGIIFAPIIIYIKSKFWDILFANYKTNVKKRKK